MVRAGIVASLLALAYSAAAIAGEPVVLTDRLHHLRIDGPREWTEFPETAEAERLELRFASEKNEGEYALRLRQQDVKQTWSVTLNDRRLGLLHRDENDMFVYFSVPAGLLRDGENLLRVQQDAARRADPDDVRIGEVSLLPHPTEQVLSEAMLAVDVTDAESGGRLPARITILNAPGALHTVGAASDEHLAVRPGTVYTSDGAARFGVPAGTYTVLAGRGFEYTLDRRQVTARAGQTTELQLAIRREVPTPGYVACDTHVHTLTHSGHGDATVEERMITIAAEGIELPIATDHNAHIDHQPTALRMNVRQYFTPVIGNEVTTPVGHFNIFPVEPGAPVPEWRLSDWAEIFRGVYRTPGVKALILNHGRDLHGPTRPLGPKLHNAVVGENLEDWPWRANAMEVVNSGATQTDAMQLFRDWMGLLNRGRRVTPVGSSDSHDVARHFVGQGRTYIRCDDRDPSQIDVEQAVNNLLQGRVMVSYGLLAELTVDGKYGPGELAAVPDERVNVAVRVLGPHWVRAEKVQLFANGQVVREAELDPAAEPVAPGVKWEGGWTLDRPKHDVHLVAVATGPGVDGPYWKTAKAYQPTSAHWEAHVIGCSGAVWLDVDGDGRETAAYDYARRLVDRTGDFAKLVEQLSGYDSAVAAQAAHLLQTSGQSLLADDAQAAIKQAAPQTQAGIRAYLEAWRENQLARSAR